MKKTIIDLTKIDTKNGVVTTYADGIMFLTNEKTNRGTAFTRNIAGGEFEYHENRGEVSYDEFVDIEWFIGKEVMAVKVNGEIRHTEIDGGYIKQFEETPDLTISSEINIATGIDSYYGNIDKTLMVESLRVTEL